MKNALVAVATTDGKRRWQASCLERHALRLELLDPLVGAGLREVELVVLVAHEAAELAVADRLRLHVGVAVGRREADDLRALLGEAVVKLARRVAEVVRVRFLRVARDGGVGGW